MDRKERIELAKILVPVANSCLGNDDLRPVGYSVACAVDLLKALVCGNRSGRPDDVFMSTKRVFSQKAPLKTQYEAAEKAVRKAWSMFFEHAPKEILVGDGLVMDRIEDAVWELTGIYEDHAPGWKEQVTVKEKNDDDR